MSNNTPLAFDHKGRLGILVNPCIALCRGITASPDAADEIYDAWHVLFRCWLKPRPWHVLICALYCVLCTVMYDFVNISNFIKSLTTQLGDNSFYFPVCHERS